MLTSLLLAYVSTNKSDSSVMPDIPATKTESKPKEKAAEQKQEQTDQTAPASEEATGNTATESEIDSEGNSKETPTQP
jgi:hypothetical protein